MRRVSVITPTLPTRTKMLGECIASVEAQTRPAFEHLIAVDIARRGPSATRNTLLAAATGDWIAALDDDDLLLPHYLERLVGDADIIYGFCEVTGKSMAVNMEFDAQRLRDRSYIPVTSLIRTDLLRDLGGWREPSECPSGFEDWDLYRRALDSGARFLCVPEVLWTYRFHGGNRTDRGGSAT